jgi:PAS domain S-box-containing protein
VIADRQALAARNRLFEMTRDLFGVATFDGRLKTINPAWAAVLDRSHEELTTRPFAEIIHPDDLATTAEVVETLMRGEPVHQFHVRLLKADGTPVAFAWSAVPDAVPASGIFYTVGRDITDEQNREEMLRQSQKMEAVGQLTGGLAHDFNNLLTGMMGNLELLQMRLARGRTDDLDRFISAAQGAGRRAASLTQRLLAFSRRQTLDPRPTDVSRLIRGLDELLRRTVGPETVVDIVDTVDLWPAMIDGTQLESALLNLCINARDAMPGAGVLPSRRATSAWINVSPFCTIWTLASICRSASPILALEWNRKSSPVHSNHSTRPSRSGRVRGLASRWCTVLPVSQGDRSGYIPNLVWARPSAFTCPGIMVTLRMTLLTTFPQRRSRAAARLFL